MRSDRGDGSRQQQQSLTEKLHLISIKGDSGAYFKIKEKHKMSEIHKGSLPVSIILTVGFLLLHLFVSCCISASTFPLNFV